MSGHDPSPGRNRLPSTDAVPVPGGIRHVTETVTLQTFSLQIIGPNDGQELAAIQSAVKVRSMMREAEENLSDLLPEGYSARIREWGAEEETPNERT